MHGGVFIAVRDTLIASERPDLQSDCEIVRVTIQIKGLKPLFVGSFYRPHSNDIDYFREIQKSLEKIPNHSYIWLLGDFNLPDIDWPSNQFTPGGKYVSSSKLLLSINEECSLRQMVMEPTREDNILDLVLTSNPSLVHSIEVKAGISDHDIVVVNADLRPVKTRPVRRKIYLYKKGNTEKNCEDLNDLNEKMDSNFVNSHSINDLWDLFTASLQKTIADNIPTKMTSSRFSLPWVTPDIRRKLRKKQRCYNRAKKSGNWKDRDAYRKLRRKIDRDIRREYRRYVSKVVGGSLESDNTKPFWKFIKAKKQQRFGIAPLNTSDGRIATSATDKAETLNHQLKSVFTDEDTSFLPLLDSYSSPPDIKQISVTEEGVLKLLSKLKTNKATGPDQISAKILKECCDAIAPLFTKIFQKSLDSGCLPDDWCKAFITPIYKKGDKANPANYRPVSFTSIPCKLLEHIIHHHIMNHMDEFDLLTDLQHGFRKNRSCKYQLALTVDDLAKSLNSQSYVDLVIMDFSKAFDTVPTKGYFINYIIWVSKDLYIPGSTTSSPIVNRVLF